MRTAHYDYIPYVTPARVVADLDRRIAMLESSGGRENIREARNLRGERERGHREAEAIQARKEQERAREARRAAALGSRVR